MKTLSTLEVLDEFVTYNSYTGEFTNLLKPDTCRINRQFNNRFGGKVAGASQGKSGYIGINIGGDRYLAHRLAWLYHHGEDPGDSQIDHINGIRTDNRIANLRMATASQNMCNSPKYKTHKGQPVKRPHKGVTAKPNGKFTAQECHDNGSYYLGTFETLAEAIKAREEQAAILHKEFKYE